MDWSGHVIGDVESWGHDMSGWVSGLEIRDDENDEGGAQAVTLVQILYDCVAEDAHHHRPGLDSDVCRAGSCDDDDHGPYPSLSPL